MRKEAKESHWRVTKGMGYGYGTVREAAYASRFGETRESKEFGVPGEARRCRHRSEGSWRQCKTQASTTQTLEMKETLSAQHMRDDSESMASMSFRTFKSLLQLMTAVSKVKVLVLLSTAAAASLALGLF